MSILKILQPKVHALTGGMIANWMPQDTVRVGDYGSLGKARFTRDGSLSNFRVDIETETTRKPSGELRYSDKTDIRVSSKISLMGQAADLARARMQLRVKLSGRGAFVYHLAGINENRLKNERKFFESLVRQVALGARLDDDAVIVISTTQADVATIIVSEMDEGSVDLEAAASDDDDGFLAKAKGQIAFKRAVGSIMHWVAADETIPLLRIVRPVFPDPDGGGGKSLSLAKIGKYVARMLAPERLEIKNINLVNYAPATRNATFQFGQKKIPVEVQLAAVSADELVRSEELSDTVGTKDLQIERIVLPKKGVMEA